MKYPNFFKKPIFKVILLSCVIISIPFLEFIKTNFFQIDQVVYSQLLLYFFFVIFCFSILIFIFLILIKERSKIEVLIITFSSIFWIIFKFDFFKTKLSFLSNNYGRYLIFWEIIIACLLILFLALFYYYLLRKKNINILFYKFISIFFIFQFSFLLIFISTLAIKDKINLLSKDVKSISNDFFSPTEIKKIKQETIKENIYFVVMDGMASLDEYKKILKKNEQTNFSSKEIDDKIKKLKEFYSNNGFNYIEDSFSTFYDTHHGFAAILNLSPLQFKGMNKNSFTYQNKLYPALLSKYNFEIKNYPKLIYTLNEIGYDFKWVGYKLNCKFINPNLCFDYTETTSVKKKFYIVNFYILKSFLVNTPIIDLYKLARQNLNIKIQLPDRKKIKDENIYNSSFEIISEFIENANKFQKSNRSYFYLLHNILPKLDDYFFHKNCNKKLTSLSDNLNELSLYIDNYECALKKVNALINYINNHDPNATVVIQADHGHYFSEKNSDDIYKIFNLIKVPNYCKDYLSNEIDNINGVRLSLSCATNSKIKLLKRVKYNKNETLN